jgi:hypothetical protein
MNLTKNNISFLLVLVLLVAFSNAKAQRGPNDTIRVHAYIDEHGDTIPEGWLEPFEIKAQMSERMKQAWAEWTRLRNAVYVTYPYAKAAGKVMNEINAKLANVTDKKQRKAIIKSREKDLKREFADKLTNLSVYQGKVLMKLIYRETGNNCYEIISEYKGGFTAAMYQTVAILFGSSLRQNYDATNGDKAMESIVKDVERMYGHRI